MDKETNDSPIEKYSDYIVYLISGLHTIYTTTEDSDILSICYVLLGLEHDDVTSLEKISLVMNRKVDQFRNNIFLFEKYSNLCHEKPYLLSNFNTLSMDSLESFVKLVTESKNIQIDGISIGDFTDPDIFIRSLRIDKIIEK